MAELVQVQSGDGPVLFEGSFTEAALEEIVVQDIIKVAGTGMSQLAATIPKCAKDLVTAFDNLSTAKKRGGSFSSAEIELGINITAEGNFMVARGSADANLKVTMTWDFS
jgi:hypothetical protein